MSTRKFILDILYAHGEATIEQIAESLKKRSGGTVSSVTIRYHLNILLDEGLVTEPRTIPRLSRGRPQHVFKAVPVVEKGVGNSAEVLSHVFAALLMQPELAGSVLEQVAITIGDTAAIPTHLPLNDRMEAAASFLNARGYEATVEPVEQGFILYTRGCPYHDLAERQLMMCGLDMRLIETLLGQPVQRLLQLAVGDSSCAYFVSNIKENC